VRSGDFAVTDVRTAARAIMSMGVDVARWYQPDGTLRPTAIAERYAELALRIVSAKPTS
jgi:hypothetical protein